MTKAKAIERAEVGVKRPIAARHSGWEVYGQRDDDRQDELWTIIKADTYAEAVTIRKLWVARRALVQLGYDKQQSVQALYRVNGNLRTIVSHAAKLLDAKQQQIDSAE